MLTAEGTAFVSDRHLATLATHARDGSIHVVPVGFTYEDGVVRVITSGGSQKVRNLRRSAQASVTQVDGARWLTFLGRATVHDDPAIVADAVERYARRYRQPRINPARVAVLIDVDRVLGSAALRLPRG